MDRTAALCGCARTGTSAPAPLQDSVIPADRTRPSGFRAAGSRSRAGTSVWLWLKEELSLYVLLHPLEE